MVYSEYEENLAKVVLPRVPEVFEINADKLRESVPVTVSIPSNAKNFERFWFMVELSKRGHRLSFFTRFPESGYVVSNYVFEAGNSFPEIMAWLRGPDCLPEVLRAMKEFDERVGRGV